MELTNLLRGRIVGVTPPSVGAALAYMSAQGMLRADYAEAMTSTNAACTVPPLFETLVAIGRGNLSAARLFEGHVNALQLVNRLGSPLQQALAFGLASEGGLLGVWGADDPERPGTMSRRGKVVELSGCKTFASGADLVALAIIVTKDGDGAKHLLLLDRAALRGRIDPTWWHPIGMRPTNSFAVKLDELVVAAGALLGPPGAYADQPFFGAGAIRFVAAQTGGLLAVFDAMRDHLAATGRARNPHQARRLGLAVAEAEAAHTTVRSSYERLARVIAWAPHPADPDDALIADVARMALAAAAERIMQLAIESVGCTGLMDHHPLARAMCDLMVYLRQPAPDEALVRVGTGLSEGRYRASFDAQG